MHDQRRIACTAGMDPAMTLWEGVAEAVSTNQKFGDSELHLDSKKMAAKAKTKHAHGAPGRGGHLRSKVEKRDDDIIHVRYLPERVPQLRRFKKMADMLF